jgi:hypothetical protein
MLRGILAIFIGYVVVTLCLFVQFAALWSVLGAEQALEPGSWTATRVWCIAALVVFFDAGIAAGIASAVVAKGTRPPKILAVLFFAVTALMAAVHDMAKSAETPALRGPDVTLVEAMTNIVMPTWVDLASALLGAIAIALGAKLIRKRP